MASRRRYFCLRRFPYNQSDMIVNIKAINVVDYFNNSYDKLYPTDTFKHFSAIISTCTQKLFDMDMEIAQLHGI